MAKVMPMESVPSQKNNTSFLESYEGRSSIPQRKGEGSKVYSKTGSRCLAVLVTPRLIRGLEFTRSIPCLPAC